MTHGTVKIPRGLFHLPAHCAFPPLAPFCSPPRPSFYALPRPLFLSLSVNFPLLCFPTPASSLSLSPSSSLSSTVFYFSFHLISFLPLSYVPLFLHDTLIPALLLGVSLFPLHCLLLRIRPYSYPHFPFYRRPLLTSYLFSLSSSLFLTLSSPPSSIRSPS